MVSWGEEPFPKHGISLKVFDKFINDCGGNQSLIGLTTSEVCERYLKPFTQEKRVSYCQMLLEDNSNHSYLGIANKFM
jgi:hypothetical protein